MDSPVTICHDYSRRVPDYKLNLVLGHTERTPKTLACVVKNPHISRMIASVVVQTLFVAYETTDEYGALGARIGYFHFRHEAEIAAAKQGAYGGKGKVSQIPALVLTDDRGDQTFYHLANTDPVSPGANLRKAKERLRKSALSKLTAEEVDALGIDK